MRTRLMLCGLLAAAVTAVGCGEKIGPTPPDGAGPAAKGITDKKGRAVKGTVDDSFPDPNYKR